MYASILVPIDGSDHAQKALALACQLARASQTTLYLLNIAEPPMTNATVGVGVGVAPPPYSTEEAEEIGNEIISKAQQAAGAEASGAHSLVRQGAPAQTIIDEAQRLGVDAIVMGSRGLSNLQGMMVGSVSHKVSHVAPCTVVTVH